MNRQADRYAHRYEIAQDLESGKIIDTVDSRRWVRCRYMGHGQVDEGTTTRLAGELIYG